jgi:hypothetical protein
VGIYVKDGDITGSQTYHFAIDGGVGLYLVNDVVSYHGKIELAGNSTTTNRSIGVYVSDGITGVLGNDMEITGADAIGIYLATNGVSGANISYHGDLSIVSTGSTLSNRGVGVVLDTGAAFTLGSGGKIEIGGNNNIGFYVKTGATLNVAGGQVSNTVDGVFAYIDDGTIHFSSSTPINIDYANVIVSGSLGVILNDTTIHVGRRGLQGSNGASVTNSALGTMKGSVDEAKALVGTSGATLHNSGSIQLSGEKSVGIYAEGGAVANSSGSVSVGKKSVAYYAGEDVGGVGGTIHVTGTSIAGAGGTIFFANGGDIHYNGANIVVGKEVTVLTLANIGSNVDFFGKTITMGEKGVGVFVTDTGDYQTISNLGSIGVGKEGTGIYLNNAVAFTGNVGMEILGESGIGILTTKNGNITYGGNLTSTASGVKGILSTGTGTLQNNGNIKLIGDSSIGIYGENTAAMINSGTGVVEIGSGNASGKAVAIYGKNAGSVNNAGLVKMQEKAVGIYGKNAVVGNSGTIQSTGKHNTGIYTEGGSVSNTGNIQLKDSSNGIFVKNGAALTNMGNVQVGNTKSAGLYGAGTTPVDHLSGTVTGGKQSVGVASESGALTVAAGANIVMNEESTYIYTESGTGTSGSNLNLSNYSIGMYTKDGTLINNGIITTGQSHVSAASQKISVGMATGTKDGLGNPIGGGAVVNNGTILIPHDYGVGMIANNPTGTASNHGTIGITGENAYGMEGSNGAVITNHGVIKANGRKVRGMAGTGNAIMINETTGKIEVNGLDAVGIYAEHGAQVWNRGEIIIDGGGKVGIHIGQGGILKNTGTITIKNGGMAIQNDGETTVNIGIITIEDGGPKVTVGDIVYDLPTLINGGYIHYVDEALDFGKVKIASTEGNIGTISAASFAKGEFIVLANATQGNNHPVQVVQYLKGAVNLPNSGSVHAISHSVTWLADLQQDPDDPDITRIVLVKIPYAELTAGTKAYEFGKGLDEIYVPAYGTELKMFDAIDMISDKDELGETFDMELRGNVYANIQHRMEDIRESFEMSYEQMSQERLYTKESLKVGAIMGGGKFKDRNPGVEDYEYKSAGFMVVKEYEHRRYGRKSGWSLGFANTEYDFTYGSKEKAYSVNVGVGYEDYVGGSQRLKYHGRVELTSSRHETVRKIHLSNGVYSNKGEFWSYEAIWKNKLRYEIPGMGDGKVRGGVFVGLDVGYGKFDKFGEKGDGIRLEVKGEDLVMVRPGIGGEVTFTQHMRRGKIMVTGVARAEYELGKYYDGANQAKLKETHADYYDLEEPKEMKEILKVGAQVKYETIGGHSVGVEVNREAGSRENSRYGVHFMYRFGK